MIKIDIDISKKSRIYVYWRRDYKRHRIDGPAVVSPSGSKEWWKEGLRHRDDNKPAFIHSNGTQHWWKEGGYIKTRVK